MYSKSNKKNIN